MNAQRECWSHSEGCRCNIDRLHCLVFKFTYSNWPYPRTWLSGLPFWEQKSLIATSVTAIGTGIPLGFLTSFLRSEPILNNKLERSLYYSNTTLAQAYVLSTMVAGRVPDRPNAQYKIVLVTVRLSKLSLCDVITPVSIQKCRPVTRL